MVGSVLTTCRSYFYTAGHASCRCILRTISRSVGHILNILTHLYHFQNLELLQKSIERNLQISTVFFHGSEPTHSLCNVRCLLYSLLSNYYLLQHQSSFVLIRYLQPPSRIHHSFVFMRRLQCVTFSKCNYRIFYLWVVEQ